MRVYVYSCWSWVASVGLQQDEKDSVLILPGEESRRENQGRGDKERKDKETNSGCKDRRVEKKKKRRKEDPMREGESRRNKTRRMTEKKGKK